MKRVSLLLYFIILLASLALAYFTWEQKPKKPGEKVPLLTCSKGDIVRITYTAEDQTVTVSKKKSPYSGASAWWVEVVRSGKDPAAEGSSTSEIFKANDRLQATIDKFCPWKALRSLGKLEEGKREEFGLTESAETLLIERSAGPRTFRLGDATFGPKDRYAADDLTGEVYLVAGQGLRDLKRSKTRFMERSLHAFKTKDVARIRLRAGDKEKELVRHASEDGKEQGWADSGSPEDAKVLYRNWVRRLSTLRPTDFMDSPADGEGCVAPPGSSQELSLTFFGPTKEIGFLTLYRGEGKDEKEEATYYACSEHTEIVVKVPKTQAETILKDLEDLLAE